MVHELIRLCAEMFDRIDYLVTLTHLRFLDRLLGPLPETPTDQAIREEGERLRQAFPHADLDDPSRRKGGARNSSGV